MNELRSEIGHTQDLIRLAKNGSERMKLQRHLSKLINCTHLPEVILNPGIYNQNGESEPIPVPFEKEMNLDEELSTYWLGWLQKAFKYEKR